MFLLNTIQFCSGPWGPAGMKVAILNGLAFFWRLNILQSIPLIAGAERQQFITPSEKPFSGT